MKSVIKRIIREFGFDLVHYHPQTEPVFPLDLDKRDIEIIRRALPYSMTSVERLYAVIQATRYIVQAKIPGDFVECGVWKGGSVLAMVHTLLDLQETSRDIHLFDTFEGMPKPLDVDISILGQPASVEFEKTRRETDSSDWCYAPIDEVKQTVFASGYSRDKFHFVQGKVEDTVPQKSPPSIALLRLDTDWYESTMHELIYLYPCLVPGGVIIIDDYGHWQGARKAVDEYLARDGGVRLLLNRIDPTGRIGIKS
jgi:O-methyltransferase